MKPSDMMGRTQWETHRDSLLARDRINDPSGGLRRIAVRGRSRLVSYEPPQMTGTSGKKRRGPRSTFSGKKRKSGPITLSAGDAR